MKKKYTQTELVYLQNNYANMSNKGLSIYLGINIRSIESKANRMGLKKSDEYLKSSIGRLNGSQGVDTRFKKGCVSHTKGKKQTDFIPPDKLENVKRNYWQKGHVPANFHKNGEIWQNKDGYYYIKFDDRIMYYHHYVWIVNGGEIWKGENLIFMDKDKNNVTIENLMIVSNSELMDINTIHQYPIELQETIKLLNKLKKKIQ